MSITATDTTVQLEFAVHVALIPAQNKVFFLSLYRFIHSLQVCIKTTTSRPFIWILMSFISLNAFLHFTIPRRQQPPLLYVFKHASILEKLSSQVKTLQTIFEADVLFGLMPAVSSCHVNTMTSQWPELCCIMTVLCDLQFDFDSSFVEIVTFKIV
jgi:hypothetical protein